MMRAIRKGAADIAAAKASLKGLMERVYAAPSPEGIPWNIAEPPDALRELVESKTVAPCRAVELGCGAGNYVIWLADRGFEAAGVDFAESAIVLARSAASRRNVACRFVADDVLGRMADVRGPFDFAYDWELLHHIFPPDRERYVRNVHRLLRSGGRYLSVCFSERDPGFGGTGKYRTTPLGTVLYFSSIEEMAALFSPFFLIEEIKTITIEGKGSIHKAVYAFMTKNK